MSKDFLLPLRRFHGRIHEWNHSRKENSSIIKYIRSPQPNVIIPVTPEHTNLGDHAIVIAQIAFLKKCGFKNIAIKEISTSAYIKHKALLKEKIPTNSLITQLGGGNMGSQWIREEQLHEDLVDSFPNNKQIIFPQTIYFSTDKQGDKVKRQSISIYNSNRNLCIIAREKKSYDIMKEIYPDIEILLVPDIVLSCSVNTFGAKDQVRNGIMFCLRNDVERALNNNDFEKLKECALSYTSECKFTDMHSDINVVTNANREELVRKKMEEFLSASLVITDRLHGMIFSAITGTPCIVLSNYNHKVKGTYEWIQHLPYIKYADTVNDVQHYISELSCITSCKYDNSPLAPHYKKLEEVVKRYAQH